MRSSLDKAGVGAGVGAARWLLLAVLLAGLLGPDRAMAHVKWFSDWSIVCPPRDPTRIFSSSLWQWMFVAAVAVMGLLAGWDTWLSRPHGALERGSRRLHHALAPWVLPALRLGVAAYWLLAAFGLSHAVYLTPELKAPDGVRGFQLVGVALVLWPRTSGLAGLIFFGLYAAALVDHGWFHLLDYPIFLFVGAALIASAPQVIGDRGRATTRALALLRWGAAITLLWGGVEKFAYPEWSYAMLSADPVLSLGVTPETAMHMYGFGEIAMAFGLLWFGVGAQVSAALLLAVFVAAVPAFGWVDLVGHSGIIVVLVLLTLTRSPQPLRQVSARVGTGLRAALFPWTVALLCLGYFGLHALYLPGATGPTVAKALDSPQRAIP